MFNWNQVKQNNLNIFYDKYQVITYHNTIAGTSK